VWNLLVLHVRRRSPLSITKNVILAAIMRMTKTAMTPAMKTRKRDVPRTYLTPHPSQKRVRERDDGGLSATRNMASHGNQLSPPQGGRRRAEHRHDERVWERIDRAQQGRMREYVFDKKEVDALRYRMEDALRAVTRYAIREARVCQLTAVLAGSL
ncbi:hypothetical protein BGW80DRAFT_1316695, partial [Lactifluus volemus]